MIIAALAFFAIAPQPHDDSFKKTLNDTFVQTGEPGAAVAVFRDGNLHASASFGTGAFDKNTRFEIGSLSKQFTATCVLMLVDQQKVRLDDRIGQVLSDLPVAWQNATIAQIMHHQSGIPDYEAVTGYDFYDAPHKLDEVLKAAETKPPAFAPGDGFAYSNTGYYLLSLAVEKSSGMPFAQFLKQKVFEPLHMDATSAGDGAPQAAIGYHVETDGLKALPPIAWSASLGAGGIVSSLSDLGKWDEALYGSTLLSEKSREFLWTSSRLNNGDSVPYGAGFFNGDFRGQVRQFHIGETNGFTCTYSRFPALHYSVFAFANSFKASSPSALAMLAIPHYAPELSYLKLAIPSHPDPSRSALHLETLRVAITGKGNLELLAKGMKDFATLEPYAGLRKELAGRLGVGAPFRFLKESSSGNSRDYLYRGDENGKPTFWTLRLIGDKLSSLNWEDE